MSTGLSMRLPIFSAHRPFLMGALRVIYVRYFRGMPLGNAARRLRYLDCRNAARQAKGGVLYTLNFGLRECRPTIAQGRVAVEQGRLYLPRILLSQIGTLDADALGGYRDPGANRGVR